MSGLISGPIMLFYIFICLFCFRYIKNNIEKKYLAKYFLIMMLTFPFWDLIIQKGIKTFVEVSGVLEPKVFNLPEKDSNGKLESLSLINVFFFKEIDNKFINKLKENIDLFLEITIYHYDQKYNRQKDNMIYYIKENQLFNNNNEKSRYRFKIINNNKLNLYNLKTYQLFDFKKELVIAEYYKMEFIDNPFFVYIRNDIFFLITGGSGSSMNYVENYSNNNDFDIMIKKIIGE